MKILKIIGLTIAGLVLLLFITLAVLYSISWVPEKDVLQEKVVELKKGPVLKAGQKVKVLVWNVQYMASKEYIFFYDRADGNGPDFYPSKENMAKTYKEVQRIIFEEDPDVLLIQELHENSKQTYHENQTVRLLKLLKGKYSYYAESFYWKTPFVAHPRIMGSAGMKLITLSKYKISKATRHSLPEIPADILSTRFGFHRAILETELPVENSKSFILFNTHFDAFSQGTDTMDRQVNIAYKLLKAKDKSKNPWIFGGDLNLIPPGFDRNELMEESRSYYDDKSQLIPLFKEFKSGATQEMLTSKGKEKYYTFFPNMPGATKPDRTIDYIFYSDILKLNSYYVRSKDTLKISDHLPVIGVVTLPK